MNYWTVFMIIVLFFIYLFIVILFGFTKLAIHQFLLHLKYFVSYRCMKNVVSILYQRIVTISAHRDFFDYFAL